MKSLSSAFFTAALAAAALPAAAAVDFSHEIVPILRKRCAECHTGDKKKGGFSFNDRASLLAGGENGAAVVPGKGAEGLLMKLVQTADPDDRMPPKGDPLTAEQIATLKTWIDEGAAWQDGFAFKKASYEPPLKPRKPELPPAVDGRAHPIDRIVDAALAKSGKSRPPRIDDAAFLRRAHLDLIGLLPTPSERDAFLADSAPDKRARLVESLLGRKSDYAEHWLTFWNDLLRNDYSGTGFITGGRKQISRWLYAALGENKPFDAFARELIAPPTDDSAGFAAGIKWRGEVSAGQTVEIQFAQSVGQAFLGINLKCASCHDSFIDRWKLDDAYGLAAIYANAPLQVHRCDKPIGRTAQAAWLFPELGQVDAKAAQPERLKQLAGLLTHPDNGRFTRTIANRFWQRLMGRGIVHPVDAMETEPWNADLLDTLANHLQENGYDLKKLLAFIATSDAYQMQSEVIGRTSDDHGYAFAGPRARRLTAEQFVDATWQLTGAAPRKFDAPVTRSDGATPASEKLTGQWIWGTDPAPGTPPPAGQQIALRGRWKLASAPRQAWAVITVDNEYTLFVNGQKIGADVDWKSVETVDLSSALKAGDNDILIVAKNAGSGPNLAAAFFEARAKTDGGTQTFASGTAWEWTATPPDGKGRFLGLPSWQKTAAIAGPWAGELAQTLEADLSAGGAPKAMVRASLVKSDFLMRTLGRPNRDQIVTVRPNDLTTLEAIDLANGQVLTDALAQGARRLAAQKWSNPTELIRYLYRFALSRDPSPDELSLATSMLGDASKTDAIQDLLWSLLLLPEFQFVR